MFHTVTRIAHQRHNAVNRQRHRVASFKHDGGLDGSGENARALVEVATGRGRSVFLPLFLSHRWVRGLQSAVCEKACRPRTYIYSWKFPFRLIGALHRPRPGSSGQTPTLSSPHPEVTVKGTWRNDICMLCIKVWATRVVRNVNVNPLTFETVFPPKHNDDSGGGTTDSVSMTKPVVSRTIKKLTYWPLPSSLSAGMSSQ